CVSSDESSPPAISTPSLHDALPISAGCGPDSSGVVGARGGRGSRQLAAPRQERPDVVPSRAPAGSIPRRRRPPPVRPLGGAQALRELGKQIRVQVQRPRRGALERYAQESRSGGDGEAAAGAVVAGFSPVN